MSTLYPTALDTTTNLPTPTASYYLNGNNPLGTPHSTFSHASQHTIVNDALIALETKMGIIGSTSRTSLDWIGRHYPLPASSANAMDDEFDGGSLNTTLWTKLNETISGDTCLYTQVSGNLIITLQSLGGTYNPGEHSRGITQPVPSGDWLFETCFTTHGAETSFRYAGMLLGEGTGTAKRELYGLLPGNTYYRAQAIASTKFNGSSYNGHRFSLNSAKGKVWIRLERSGTTINAYYSYDGLYFIQYISHSQLNFLGSVDVIGLHVQSTSFTASDSYQSAASFEYFRRLA